MNKRSPKFPKISLELCLESLGKISNDIPSEGVPKEKIAEFLGYKSLNGPARTMLASLVGYGLLERRPFKISPLGQALLENGQSLPFRRRAALKPKVYRMMFRRARDLSQEDLANRLMENRFTEEGAKRAVEVFAENRAFAQLDDMDPANERDKRPHAGPGRKNRKGRRHGKGMDPGQGMGPRGNGRGPGRRPGRMCRPPAAVFRVPVGAGHDAELRFFGGRPKAESLNALRKYLDLIETTL